ncbi:MAG TPA: DUF3592 domain-containing protein [Pseudomonas sp.]|uniref:DUF3592 domain-containing protein n=1 Tax=Pseudomonas sp. TaxID=306 RepID=UPI002ED8F5D0
MLKDNIGKYILWVFGAVWLVAGFMAFRESFPFLIKGELASGRVFELAVDQSGGSLVYKPVIQFETHDGQLVEFTSSVGSFPASHSVGERVEVVYMPSNPDSAKVNSFFELWVGGALCFVAGISICGFMFWLERSAKRQRENLLQNGLVVAAQFQSVEYDLNLYSKGRYPFVIECCWVDPETSETHFFKSEPIWFDPTDYIDSETLKVFVEKDCPQIYHVDISFLPKMAR